MKRTTLFLATFLAAVSFLGVSSAFGRVEDQIPAVRKAVAGVAAPEIVATAAKVLSQASFKERADVAVALVRVLVTQKPALAPVLVSALSKVAPEHSPTVASEAAKLSADQVGEIVKAAVTATPEQSDAIAAAVVAVVPEHAVQVARVAVSVSPTYADRVVERVISVAPASQRQIQADEVVASARKGSRSSAVTGGSQGSISSFNGTIRGTVPAGTPTAISTGQITVGYDSDRDAYARPQ
jgi:hypothetical protein